MNKKLPPGVAEINQFYSEVNKVFEKAGEGATRKSPTIPEDQNIKPHTTHFDDCGCKSARYEARIQKLEGEREKQLREAFIQGALKSQAWDVGTISKGRSFGMYVADEFKQFLASLTQSQEEER